MVETKIEPEKTRAVNEDVSWSVEEKFLHGNMVREALKEMLEKIKQQEQMTPLDEFDLDDEINFHEAKRRIWQEDELKKQFSEKQMELEKDDTK